MAIEERSGFCVIEKDEKLFLCRPPYTDLGEEIAPEELERLSSSLELRPIHQQFPRLSLLFEAVRGTLKLASLQRDAPAFRQEIISQSVPKLSADTLVAMGRTIVDRRVMNDLLAFIQGVNFSSVRSSSVLYLVQQARAVISSELDETVRQIEQDAPAGQDASKRSINSLFFGRPR